MADAADTTQIDGIEKIEKKKIRDKSKITINAELREALFTAEYLRNGHNGTRAAYTAYNVTTDKSAGAVAAKVLARDRVAAKIKDVINGYNLDSKVQLTNLVEIARGEYVSTTTSTVTMPDGRETTTVTRKQCTAAERVAAINAIAKLTGQYDANKVKAQVMGRELASLYRDVFPARGKGPHSIAEPDAMATDAIGGEAIASTVEDSVEHSKREPDAIASGETEPGGAEAGGDLL